MKASQRMTLPSTEPARLLSSQDRAKTLMLVLTVCACCYVIFNGANVDATLRSLAQSSMIPSNETTVYPYIELRRQAKRMFALTPHDEFTPKLAWLMSFPNSGTSFTMVSTSYLSERAVATNYGDEVTKPEMGDTISVYPRRPEGPYWTGLSGMVGTPRPLPDKYVLTKTHCGSRCVDCAPHDYVETTETFLRRCATGSRRKVFGSSNGNKWRRISTEYPPSRVHKAIHLIRNPMHNAIARFHLDYRNRAASRWPEIRAFTEKHDQDAAGFRAWCDDIDSRYVGRETAYFSKSASPINYDLIKDVPCHTEFFKWTQWHNLAFESIEFIRENYHDVPILTVHYEDYSTDCNRTVDKIVDFLELDSTGIRLGFRQRPDYDTFYNDDLIAPIRRMIKTVANENTWKQVKHYFD